MHLQKWRRQLLPGLVAGDVPFHPCIPEVNVLQDASWKYVRAVLSPCRLLGGPGWTDTVFTLPLLFHRRKPAMSSPPTSHCSPIFTVHGLFFFSVGVGRGRFESMLSSAPKGPGPPLSLAICHLPPLPARVEECTDKGVVAAGPCVSRCAPAPGRVVGPLGCNPRHPGQPFPRLVPGRAVGRDTAGTQQMGCEARGSPPSHPSPCLRLLPPYPSPGLARVSPVEVRGE